MPCKSFGDITGMGSVYSILGNRILRYPFEKFFSIIKLVMEFVFRYQANSCGCIQ
jgi:hypothetical protein